MLETKTRCKTSLASVQHYFKLQKLNSKNTVQEKTARYFLILLICLIFS